MTTTPALLDCVEIQTGPAPTRSVIWLHGLGADGNDFAPIVPELVLDGLPDIRFVFPHALVQPVTINNGMAMRSWYDILVMDLVRREDEGGIRASAEQIERLIARERARGVESRHIVLAGFSQGCAMALHTALAGVMGLSGYLPLADFLATERVESNTGVPIFLAHGTQDPVVPLARAEATRTALTAAGYAVQWQTYPMPHSVCAAEIDDISDFLRQVLA
jgi:phospholipase/carboxylesterase